MKIRLNPDTEIVNTIKEGLKKTGGYCPCRREKRMIPSVCARNSRIRLPIQALKAFATVCSTIRKSNISIKYHNKI